MSITVVSNEAAKAEAVKPVEAFEKEQPASAPGVDTPEQNTAAKSDTAETEDKEDVSDASEAEGDEPEATDEAAKEAPKKKGGFQRRIDKLNARATAAQEEAAYWKQQALKGAGATEPAAKVEEPKAAEVTGEPNPESFDTHAEYVKAVVKWDREQAANAAKARTDLEAEHKRTVEAYQSKVKDFAAKHDDFDDVIANLDGIHSVTVEQIILSSENGPALLYELAKNKGEAVRIAALSPLAAARELGKIEARLASQSTDAPKAEPKQITKAPKPIAPVGGKGGVVEKSITDPNLSQREYEAIRRQQLAARKAAW